MHFKYPSQLFTAYGAMKNQNKILSKRFVKLNSKFHELKHYLTKRKMGLAMLDKYEISMKKINPMLAMADKYKKSLKTLNMQAKSCREHKHVVCLDHTERNKLTRLLNAPWKVKRSRNGVWSVMGVGLTRRKHG